MTTPLLTSLDDDALAAHVAGEAGALLMALRASDGFSHPDALRGAGDRRANQLICDLLTTARPDDPILSEEAADLSDRLSSRRVWIVDPLDGTREFGEEGRTDWAVHIALALDGHITTSAVALPARDLVLNANPSTGLPSAHDGPVRVVTSRTRNPPAARAVAAALDAELLPMGSAGAKAMAVVLGEADVYAHSGGMYQWDSAAPVGVALAAGLHVSRIDGSPIVYNAADTWLPDVLVCRPELADTALAALVGVPSE